MYSKVLLKLSGEALGSKDNVFSFETMENAVMEIKELVDNNVQVGIVVGGGNMVRGKTLSKIGFDRCEADHMGMLATVLNAMALSACLRKNGVKAIAMSALDVEGVEKADVKKARELLNEGYVIVFGGGIGNPYFSTDTTVALRAIEMGAEVILMAKNGVDGVYDSDPDNNPNAKRFDELSFDDILNMNLKVMDMTAASLCRDNGIDALVFDMGVKGNILKAAKSEAVCTVVKSH
ncbi:MAG: UMP kinase [Erysipelotrichaceae bacterium]|nr:UMP kinase [Erysipelotrichaceae bacterium]